MPTPTQRNPTRAELLDAADKTVPDLIAPGLDVLFCGINPGLYSAYTGHHFARPGNRFWPALHLGGFTPRLLLPSEEQQLLGLGLGITNLVQRASATADELTKEELAAGGARLAAKVQHYAPRVLAVLGVGAYRSAFAQPKAALGLQPATIGGAPVWVLPNPSGLNAHYTLEGLAAVFAELHRAVQQGLDRNPKDKEN
jgi:TDG/mug DNA glycosylase family protein